MTDMLRIAVPNKGSLSVAASDLLREAGYRQREDSKRLTLIDEENGVEFFYLRPRDIALYVGEGTLDIGITGRDLLLDSGAKADEVVGLGFGRSRFHFASTVGAFTSIEQLRGKRIATSYVGVVTDYLEREGIDASVTRLDGAVETSIQLGVADAIADVVETGSTMRQAGLEVFGEPIMHSEAVVITRSGDEPGSATSALPAAYETFKRRLDGVLIARSYVMMDYDIRAADLAEASAMTPGLEGPTVSPLHREGWVAVRAMVPREGSQRLMDDLYAVGARAILLTAINACRI
ncbi:ATP phosphoribosyltransferase (homohexameric) [Nocardioides albertanoniae]|uniref:ATP phosphoribosyltransferase n=1 Tax=Nocardioides albertanoniae TaxID=1175486 RepID=A0A543A8E6_9ACTN|nr:ATP phosphoribosyltransferase [Nocardioides albertanoniae]TQL68780.1 ATP phosphoribosyltransferase (homohexameric) [Nocardioides albertanoniae]